MLAKYYRINQAVGVSVDLITDGISRLNACEVIVKDNQLEISKKLIGLHSFEELKKHFPDKTVISINLSGKGILHKQIEKVEHINQNNFSKVLPNAKIDDFYIQNFITGIYSFVSLIRKVEVDKLIDQLLRLGYKPMLLSLGPYPVNNIISQLNVYGTELIFNGNIILYNEQQELLSYQYNESTISPFTLKVQSEIIDEKLLIAYSCAFQLVMSDKVELIRSEVPDLESAFIKEIDERKLKFQGVLVLATFFVLLLINFFVFSLLNSSNIKLAGLVSRSAQSTSDVQQIDEQVQQKEALLKSLGWEDNINKSLLIDQIASLLPQDITWTAAAVDPVDLSASRIQRNVVFSNRLIKITGNSEKIIPVNEWIARIRTKPWVKNVQLSSYTYNNELNTGQFNLSIEY